VSASCAYDMCFVCVWVWSCAGGSQGCVETEGDSQGLSELGVEGECGLGVAWLGNSNVCGDVQAH
jgi:hypothetical protein